MKFLIRLFAGLVVGFFVVNFITDYEPTSIIQKSYSSKECVQVIGPDYYSCVNLPVKYEIEWVK